MIKIEAHFDVCSNHNGAFEAISEQKFKNIVVFLNRKVFNTNNFLHYFSRINPQVTSTEKLQLLGHIYICLLGLSSIYLYVRSFIYIFLC